MKLAAPKWAWGLSLSICFSIGLCFVSLNLHPRFEHRNETIEQQFSILKGEPFLLDGKPAYFRNFENRVLFPLILKATTSIGLLKVSQWYLLLRLFSAMLAFLTVWSVSTTILKVSNKVAAAGMMLLLYATIYTFNHGWEHPNDFLEIIFFSLFFASAVKKHKLSMAILAVIASFNRESSPFGGLLWCFLYGLEKTPARKWRLDVKESLFGAFLIALSLLTVQIVRCTVTGKWELSQQVVQKSWTYGMLQDLARNVGPLMWPVLFIAMFLPLVVWIWSNRSFWNAMYRRLFVAGLTMTFLSFPLSIPSELRGFLPMITLLTLTAIGLEGFASKHKH